MSTHGPTPAGVSPATTVTGPDAFGASAVVGTGLLYARNDHDHGLPANPVTLSAVEGVFTAKGQLLAGTGSGTGDLLATGTAGQVLTVGGADASGLEWAAAGGGSYPLHSPVYGHLAASVTLTASSVTTIQTTGSLAIGTWLLNWTGYVECSVGGYSQVNVTCQAGTATCTFDGCWSTENINDSTYTGGIPYRSVSLNAVVIVTVAGTVTIIGNNGDVNVGYVAATTGNPVNYAGATGYVATQVA